jgi:putative ABC transport system permease protein
VPLRRWWFLAAAVLVLALLPRAGSPAATPNESPNESPNNPPTIIVSRQLAAALGARDGSIIIQLSADPTGKNAKPFRIVGSYEPTPDPFRLASERLEARLHLPDLLALTADPADPSLADSVTSINVALRDPADAVAFAREVTARMPGLVGRPTVPEQDEGNPFVVLKRFHLAIAVVTVVASTIFLLALMVMVVDERRETVGMLRLIGLQRRRILLQVFAEGLLIALSGALAGVLLAAACQLAFNRFFQWRYDTALVFVRVTPQIAARCLAVAVPLGMLASIVSSWGLLRRDVFSLARR